ncbi:hypothetical protein GOARA_021_00340 [Gordonia araii NBRC 100433]|uniref:Uncharacterized protein n=1 Tax=Gordonia araii NBRC 100433 TaxID=1073574 RepID=G7GYX2_9ACTN|nr:hypothetical protein [Gordonia araii]NNG97007.1 hypothetical protein [Gordonia araii NBRC 100433]GAB08797.1 hypothetical protein GOARA_021_00340 [Gordonia araii NBRC 100433]
MLYLVIAAIIGEILYLLMRNPNGLDFRGREFSDALHDRELKLERRRKEARQAVEAGPRHRAA